LKVRIYTDGGSRGNPGPAAAGVVVTDADTNQPLWRAGLFLGTATNNVAEYSGMISGLKQAVAMGATDVEVVSDSELMVRQMLGQYRVKNKGLAPLFAEATGLCQQLDKVQFRHVRRENNKEADRLVNLALDAKQSIENPPF
jgi:ribonuclease HI